jgi:hypothetical protein
MFKYSMSIIAFLSVFSAICATRSLAEIAESTSQNRTATQQSDTVNLPNLNRSPEEIERERERGNVRKQNAREEQLEWRRKYGDLAPSRQRPAL